MNIQKIVKKLEDIDYSTLDIDQFLDDIELLIFADYLGISNE